MSLMRSAIADDVRRTLRHADLRAAQYLADPDRSLERQVLLLVLLAILCLVGRRYLSDPNAIVAWADGLGWSEAVHWLDAQFANPTSGRFAALILWGLAGLLMYLVVPMLAIVTAGGRLGDFGWRTCTTRELAYTLASCAILVPAVTSVATLDVFLAYYPFYGEIEDSSEWRLFAIFEIVYVAQFISVEFFFRGFLINATRPRLGSFSIIFSVVPYVMVHFGKPLPECAGALAAGLLLGYLSLRTGSIIPGVLLHVAVALTMDFSTLYFQGGLG